MRALKTYQAERQQHEKPFKKQDLSKERILQLLKYHYKANEYYERIFLNYGTDTTNVLVHCFRR